MDVIRIASRASQLALAQSRLVAELISAKLGVRAEIVPMLTRGDTTAGALTAMGGKGLFTAELEAALRQGRVDIAVHSAKDLPADLPGDMSIVACPPRSDPRDALVRPDGASADLPAGARVGTSSHRRAAQVLRRWPTARIVPLRGNVETRLGKVLTGELDAAVLAMAGLIRTGLTQRHAGQIHPLALEDFIPAAGQGVLAVQAITENVALAAKLAAIDHPPSRQALLAERTVGAPSWGPTAIRCWASIYISTSPAGPAWPSPGARRPSRRRPCPHRRPPLRRPGRPAVAGRPAPPGCGWSRCRGIERPLSLHGRGWLAEGESGEGANTEDTLTPALSHQGRGGATATLLSRCDIRLASRRCGQGTRLVG